MRVLCKVITDADQRFVTCVTVNNNRQNLVQILKYEFLREFRVRDFPVSSRLHITGKLHFTR